ncbi:MAG: hypothetical protein ACREDR_27820 [Blastocatellia bacterium]
MIAAQLDFDKPLIKTEPDILTTEECQGWIERIRRAGPEPAPINTPGGTAIDSRVRNNRRVMFDDPEAAGLLFDRVRVNAPEEIRGVNLSGIKGGVKYVIRTDLMYR